MQHFGFKITLYTIYKQKSSQKALEKSEKPIAHINLTVPNILGPLWDFVTILI